jgi:AcrR family transcriptional regulator
MRTFPGIAPADLLLQDFRALDARETLRCAWKTEQNILLQSVLGHAHEGHGLFRGQRYVNTTMDDIARALRLDPQAVRSERQELIDGVRAYVDAVIAGGDGAMLVDKQGGPLLTMGTLPLFAVDGPGVLRGFYLGGLRDDSQLRRGAEARYNVRIGGGESYLVHLPTMHDAGHDGDRLAHEDHDAATLQRFRDIGLIVGDAGPDSDETAYLYIRHRRGSGTSDDACILFCGLLHGFSAAVGAFLADAVDTLEKYVPVFGGQDGAIAAQIEQGFAGLNLTRRDAEDIAYLCANESGDVPDSSLRHLLSVDRRFDQCAAEAHLLYLLHRPYAPLGLSHERTSNAELYAYGEARLKKWRALP